MKQYSAGTTIIQQGTKSKSFYILMTGKIGIYKDGIKLADYSEPGTVVGELSAILGKPRSATVLCLTDAELIEIDGDIDEQIVRHPDIIQYILLNLAERLYNTTEGLVVSSNKKGFKNLQNHVTDF